MFFFSKGTKINNFQNQKNKKLIGLKIDVGFFLELEIRLQLSSIPKNKKTNQLLLANYNVATPVMWLLQQSFPKQPLKLECFLLN